MPRIVVIHRLIVFVFFLTAFISLDGARIALTGDSPEAESLAELVMSSFDKDYVERSAIRSIMTEQKLMASGLTELDCYRLGRLLKAELIARIESAQPQKDKIIPSRLIIHETSLGLRLADVPLAGSLEEASVLVNTELTKAEQLLKNPQSAVMISIAGVRDTGLSKTAIPLAQRRLLEFIQRLTATDHLITLERDYLNLIIQEGRLSGQFGKLAAAATMLRLDLLPGSEAADAVLRVEISAPDGRKLNEFTADLKPEDAPAQLVNEITGYFKLAPKNMDFNTEREAERFFAEAAWPHYPYGITVDKLSNAYYLSKNRKKAAWRALELLEVHKDRDLREELKAIRLLDAMITDYQAPPPYVNRKAANPFNNINTETYNLEFRLKDKLIRVGRHEVYTQYLDSEKQELIDISRRSRAYWISLAKIGLEVVDERPAVKDFERLSRITVYSENLINFLDYQFYCGDTGGLDEFFWAFDELLKRPFLLTAKDIGYEKLASALLIAPLPKRSELAGKIAQRLRVFAENAGSDDKAEKAALNALVFEFFSATGSPPAMNPQEFTLLTAKLLNEYYAKTNKYPEDLSYVIYNLADDHSKCREYARIVDSEITRLKQSRNQVTAKSSLEREKVREQLKSLVKQFNDANYRNLRNDYYNLQMSARKWALFDGEFYGELNPGFAFRTIWSAGNFPQNTFIVAAAAGDDMNYYALAKDPARTMVWRLDPVTGSFEKITSIESPNYLPQPQRLAYSLPITSMTVSGGYAVVKDPTTFVSGAGQKAQVHSGDIVKIIPLGAGKTVEIADLPGPPVFALVSGERLWYADRHSVSSCNLNGGDRKVAFSSRNADDPLLKSLSNSKSELNIDGMWAAPGGKILLLMLNSFCLYDPAAHSLTPKFESTILFPERVKTVRSGNQLWFAATQNEINQGSPYWVPAMEQELRYRRPGALGYYDFAAEQGVVLYAAIPEKTRDLYRFSSPPRKFTENLNFSYSPLIIGNDMLYTGRNLKVLETYPVEGPGGAPRLISPEVQEVFPLIQGSKLLFFTEHFIFEVTLKDKAEESVIPGLLPSVE